MILIHCVIYLHNTNTYLLDYMFIEIENYPYFLRLLLVTFCDSWRIVIGDVLWLVTFCDRWHFVWWCFVRWHFVMVTFCYRWRFVRWRFVGVPKMLYFGGKLWNVLCWEKTTECTVWVGRVVRLKCIFILGESCEMHCAEKDHRMHCVGGEQGETIMLCVKAVNSSLLVECCEMYNMNI